MCLGASPCPYSTAGTSPARRVRRAPPLPNSVRGSALIFTSDTGLLLICYERWFGVLERCGLCGARARAQAGGACTHAASTAPITAPDPFATFRRRPGGALAVATGTVYRRLRRWLTPSPPVARSPVPVATAAPSPVRVDSPAARRAGRALVRNRA